jgi:uncharacterized membrane protein
MAGVLHQIFSLVCGQNPDHTWILAGTALPCCQRCSGIYVGACAALPLQFFCRPKATTPFLVLHGLFLLALAVCGLHLVPQGPALRSISGVLGGFAITAFLWVLPGRLCMRAPKPGKTHRTAIYYAILLATAPLLPAIASRGGYGATLLLISAASLGLLFLLVLAGLTIGSALRLALARLRSL